jgi:diguanylate cyclase (GGDEF)-like protein
MPPPARDQADARNGRYKRGLTLRYVVALCLVAALALLSYGVFRHIGATIDRSAAITAVNGSQRLLIQRVLAQCLLLAAADDEEARRDIRAHLARAVDTLEANHARLLADLGDPGSLAARSPELAVLYFKPPYELDRRMRFFLDATRTFYRSDAGRPALSDPKFLDVLAFGQDELLRDLGRVVQEYQRQAVGRLAILRRVELATTVGMLGLLAAVGLCILRPMVRRICADRERLEGANEALTELAVTDQLTGAYNRLKFNQVMEHEVKRTSRYAEPLSVIMFDIDHFKAVNDTYGHAAGDDMLRELTRRVHAAIRAVDWLFRYGGEEFVVAAPHTGRTQAAVLAEKLRALVAGAPFPFGIAGSISLGVTEFAPGETVEELMQRVDAALYEAKNSGRNRVVVVEAEAAEKREAASGGRGGSSPLDPLDGKVG